MRKVIPILHTQVNWDHYIKACQSALGYSPVRSLDEAGIKTSRPCAFAATLDFKDQPRKVLSDRDYAGVAFDIVSFGFITAAYDDTIAYIAANSRLKLKYNRTSANNLLILMGTINEWHDAVINVLTSEAPVFDALVIISECMGYIEGYGFKALWKEYKRVDVEGTFKLVRMK